MGEKAKVQLIRDSKKDIELSITELQKNPLNYTQVGNLCFFPKEDRTKGFIQDVSAYIYMLASCAFVSKLSIIMLEKCHNCLDFTF